MRTRKPQKLGTKSIDMLALAAALLWMCSTVGYSLWNGIWWADGSTILAWLTRGMWGAILVYGVVFLLLHAVMLKTRSPNDGKFNRGKENQHHEKKAN